MPNKSYAKFAESSSKLRNSKKDYFGNTLDTACKNTLKEMPEKRLAIFTQSFFARIT